MWAAIVGVLSWIWGGIESATVALVHYLLWFVNFLFGAIIATGNALVKLGRVVEGGLKDVWDFSKWTYDNVLKPIGLKIYNLVVRVKHALDKLLRPVFTFLKAVRDEILKIYTRFVRPVLDIIDATRAILQILEKLHIAWAAALDNWLTTIEGKINDSFLFVLQQINGLINWVNKIATFDGLLQRFALVASLERDAAYWIGTFWRHTVGTLPATNTPGTTLNPFPPYGPDYYGQQLAAFYTTGGGDLADGIAAAVPLWAQAAGLAPASP